MKTPLARLPREELDELTDRLTDAEIGELYGLGRTAATVHRKRLGVASWAQKHGRRRYRESYEPLPGAKRAFSHRRGCNERCFSVIDSAASAYWLGLLAADGWIVTHHHRPVGTALALHSRDIDLLRQYADFVGFRGEPRRTRPGSELHQVKISSALMAPDLMAQGVVPRKSFVVEMPDMSSSLKPHYLRGLFDGDGSVGRRGASLSAQITTASKRLAEQVQSLADGVTPRPCSLSRDRNTFVLRWYADNAMALADYLYQGDPAASPRMQRKVEVFFGFQGSGAGHS